MVKWRLPTSASDVGGRQIKIEGIFTIPLTLLFGNHWTLDVKDHAVEVMKTSKDYDPLLPAWYSNQHKAAGITTGHLHFPHCGIECFGHGHMRPEYTMTYDKTIALWPDAINIGAVVCNSPSLLEKLPKHYHKWLLLFDRKEAEKLPMHKESYHQIELLSSEDKLRMGPIYKVSMEEEKLLVEYLNKMIKEGKIRPSSSSVGSQILLVPKPNRKGVRICIDYRHLNQHTVKDKTPLPIMLELQRRIFGADFITQIDLKPGFHFIRMAMGHEKYTAFRTKFGLYEYMVMPLGLTNAPATFQREINRILPPLLGVELVINKKIDVDEDGGLVVVTYIDNILIATKGSIIKHRNQARGVFDFLLENNICVEIDK